MKTTIIITMLLVANVAAADIVLALDGKDIYIDLGAKDGVGAGSELELLHEVVVKDPRNGATLRDHFALGTITVAKSGEKVSVARADDDLRKRVIAGDRVRLISAKKTFVDPWAEQVAATKGSSPGPTPGPAPAPAVPGKPIDHAELAKKAFQDTLGKPLDQRIKRWNELLKEDPRSPYAPAIQREIKTLEAQAATRDAALAKARSSNAADRAPRIAALANLLTDEYRSVLAMAPIKKAEPGKDLAVTFLVRSPQHIAKAWLYIRPPGEPGFKRLDLVPDGDAYLRAQIDGAQVRAPGVQWYVEAVGHGEVAQDAEPASVLGSQSAPNLIDVEIAVREAPIERGRSHIDMHVDYVDFDGGFAKGHDQYYQAEIDFAYRFLSPVYQVRLGFGTLGGKGGPKDIIDDDMTGRCLDEAGNYRCKAVNFSYVYTEIEYRVRPNVAIMVRPQAGLRTEDVMPSPRFNRCAGTDDVAGCEFSTGFGGRMRLRLGREESTNLVLGAGFTKGVGTLLEATYHWLPRPVVPIQLSVQVTDQPIAENLGVRLIGDVGWRKLSWFYPSLRASYQARDIDHSGFSGGFAMNFDW